MIKVGSDFSGVGAFDQALIRLGIEHETVFACDMDKYARQTYTLNFGEPKYYPENVYDRIIPSDSLDIYMSSPPCQAFSLAGKRKGEADKRGILFYNTHEFICKNKPRYFIIENVKGLLSDAGGKTFQNWLDLLGGKSINGKTIMFPNEDAAPYHIHYQVLNAKHYGVPQNRERVFIVGIRDDEDNSFRFPTKIPLTKRLRDVLEEFVDEKYYLSENYINAVTRHSDRHQEKGNGFEFTPTDGNCIAVSITTKSGQRTTDNYILDGNSQDQKLSHLDGVSQTLNAGHFNQPKVLQDTIIEHRGHKNKEATFIHTGIVPTLRAESHGHESKVVVNEVIQLNPSKESCGKQPYQQNRVYDIKGVCHAISAGQEVWKGNIVNTQRIRRLTPLECFRLMDFNENFHSTIEFNNITNSQGILLSLQNKKDIKWNVKELDATEKQKLKECVCSIIKDGTNTVMKTLCLNTHTEVIQNAQLKIAVEMFTAKDIAQNTTILTENGATLYLAKNNNQKSLKKQDNELLILEEKVGLEEKGSLCTDYYLRLSLDENLKEVSAYTILTTIQTITNCLTCIYSIPKENTISVILNYKSYQNNFLKGELLNLKMVNTILSDSQLYKQAGNSIVVACLEKIIKNLNF